MKNLLFALVLSLSLNTASAQVLQSGAWHGPSVACTGGDQLMPLDNAGHWETQNAPPGAGPWPAGYSVTVREVCVMHDGNGDPFGAYAVAGHWTPSGVGVDHSTPYVRGWGTQCKVYTADKPLVVMGGDYFDVHAACSSGSHRIALQIWYTRP